MGRTTGARGGELRGPVSPGTTVEPDLDNASGGRCLRKTAKARVNEPGAFLFVVAMSMCTETKCITLSGKSLPRR